MKPAVTLQSCIGEYRRQMAKGEIQQAYRGLLEFLMELKNHLAKKHIDYQVSGNIYQGFMDMSYFSFTPEPLKNRKLKIAVVLLHETVSFEVWLAGANKQIQEKYWKLFRKNGFEKYRIPADNKGIDSIVEFTLDENPDFYDLKNLIHSLESGILSFISDVSIFLEEKSPTGIVE